MCRYRFSVLADEVSPGSSYVILFIRPLVKIMYVYDNIFELYSTRTVFKICLTRIQESLRIPTTHLNAHIGL